MRTLMWRVGEDPPDRWRSVVPAEGFPIEPERMRGPVFLFRPPVTSLTALMTLVRPWWILSACLHTFRKSGS